MSSGAAVAMILFDDDVPTGSSSGSETEHMDTMDHTGARHQRLLLEHDWKYVHVLGEGAHAQVLLVRDATDRPVAVKCVDMMNWNIANEEHRKTMEKEAQFLRQMRHTNIVHMLGQELSADYLYIFLEFANGGELFDQIEPDVGMPSIKAQHYFVQLLSAVRYMHHFHSMAHRDIKPENLLLVKGNYVAAPSGLSSDRLVLTDFGYATVFRLGPQGRRRTSTTHCGTPPYMAPEIFHRGPYDPSMVDVWSSGVVLVAMLTGLMPFNEATSKCPLYNSWLARGGDGKTQRSPWNAVGTMPLALICAMLEPQPLLRCSVDKALRSKWLVTDLTKQPPGVSRERSRDDPPVGGSQPAPAANPHPPLLRHAAAVMVDMFAGDVDNDEIVDVSAGSGMDVNDNESPVRHGHARPAHNAGSVGGVAFSQPVDVNAALLPSQQATQQSQMQHMGADWLLRTYRRMTRFTLLVPLSDCLRELGLVAGRLSCHCRTALHSPGAAGGGGSALLVWTAADERGQPITMHVRCVEVPAHRCHTLVEFHRTKGDGLQSKRMFVKVRDQLHWAICKHGIDEPCPAQSGQLDDE